MRKVWYNHFPGYDIKAAIVDEYHDSFFGADMVTIKITEKRRRGELIEVFKNSAFIRERK